MSSDLASRQAATAEWAQDDSNHISSHRSQPHQHTRLENSFKPSSPFYTPLDTQAAPSTKAAQSHTQAGLFQQSQGTRHSSNTLQPNDIASPAFSFDDYLTPEFTSSDIPFSEQSVQTTPCVSELKWQEGISRTNNSEDVDPILYSNTGNAEFDLGDTLNNFHYNYDPKLIVAADNKPLETNHSPRLAASHMSNQGQLSRQQGSLSVQTSGLQRSPSMAKRTYDESEANTVSDTLHRQPRSAGGHDRPPASHLVSPSVLVSTYSRGDSPARNQFPMARSLSKRSQSSRLGEVSNTAGSQHPTPAASHLVPPVNVDDDELEEEDEGQRSGLAPDVRDPGLVPSLKDMDEQRGLDGTRADVESWLATSEAGSLSDSPTRNSGRENRDRHGKIRSHSIGTRHDAMGLKVYDDSLVRGPGLLIDETSDYHYSDDEEVPAQIDPAASEDESYFPRIEAKHEDPSPDELEPLPRQFYRKTPWQDPVRGSEISTTHDQPKTANAAMVYYERQAANFDTASRAATWGTRRLSDSEIASILDGSQVSRHLSLKDTFANKARARGSTFINSVKNSIPGRSNSFIKKHKQASSRQPSPEEKVERMTSPALEGHRNSTSSISRLHRMSSSSKAKPPKSPPLDTGGAFMAMTSHLAAVGGSTGAAPEADQGSSLFGTLKRHRSKSEMSKSPKPSIGLSQLRTQHSGSTIPVLASPVQMKEPPSLPLGHSDQDMDEDADDDEVGVKMDMPMRAMNIIPDISGFRAHVRQLNPRLEPFLVDRIATDQLRRFKKLVRSRAEHMQSVLATGECSSGPHCHELGGRATPLPPRTNSKDTSTNLAQFKVAGGDSDVEEGNFVDGVISPALFPPGIPLPPAKTLPAEFECFLCFQVKKFQKPSDWTKHVHEDVQPFSCTFPNCPEPKSFKRKADWVRHENERHRHLEWWKCSISECNHRCFRKDNFVQHLVREHKMTEPKSKASKMTGARAQAQARTAPTSGQSPEDFWHLVDSCRHETTRKPKDEACKFCNNRCNTWKKLSVHVAKHMEQIAMPVLDLAKRQNVTAETVVSPMELVPSHSYSSAMLEPSIAGPSEQYPHSPYSTGAHSASHSPAVAQADPQVLLSHMNANSYQTNNGIQAVPMGYNYNGYGNGNVANHDYLVGQTAGVYPQPPMVPAYTVSYDPQFTQAQQAENTYATAANGAMQVPFGSQQQYYAVNGISETYGHNYGSGVSHESGGMAPRIHPGHSSHGHTPVSTGPGDDNGFHPTHQTRSSSQGYY